LRNAVVQECFKRGLLVLGAGASTIRLSPPLVIDKEQADCAARILSESISAATS
jgi:4-aminobutyrate aminotransferase